ncbi:MAG: EAL domain-containing protein [Clostridia bacterium]|nr:EAL domain-containing protein [Clostridia bacterium]
MRYDISYEITSLVFLICIAVHFYSKKSYPSSLNNMFGLYLSCCMADIVLDIIGVGLIADAELVPLWLNYAVNIGYYLMQMLMPYLMFSYVLILTERMAAMRLKRRFMTALPFLVIAVVIITTPFTRLIFYYDENLVYTYGDISWITYVFSTGYVIATDAIIIIDRQKLTRRHLITLLSFTVISFIAITIQFFNHRLLVTGVAMTACLMILYLTLQNSRHITDGLTEMLDKNSFDLYIREQMLLRSSRSYIVIVGLCSIRVLELTLGVYLTEKLIKHLCAHVNELSESNPTFRINDEQVAIVLSGKDSARVLAGCLHNSVNCSHNLDGMEISVSGSVAYMQTPCQRYSHSDVLHIIQRMTDIIRKCADNRLICFDESAIEQLRREESIIHAMRESVDDPSKPGLQVWLQPMFSPGNGRFMSAEALLRFTHPTLGSISPEEFIPLAESNAILPELGEFVLRRVCEYERDYSLSRMLKNISINISEAELLNEGIARRTMGIIEEFAIDKSFICLEVMETIDTDSYPAIHRHINEISSSGVSFLLDDFGCGYANFDSIMSLPFACVKLDKSILNATENSPRAQVVLKVMINMIHDIDMLVIAEGAENREQVALLESMGVDLIQGYYFAHAMPIAQCVEFLKSAEATSRERALSACH